MNIELKHILAYLPYDLKIKWNDTKEIMGITLEDQTDYNNMKYPLSTIAYCIENQDERELSFKLLLRPYVKIRRLSETPYGIIEDLIKNHYDVFGLIQNGFAEVKNEHSQDS